MSKFPSLFEKACDPDTNLAGLELSNIFFKDPYSLNPNPLNSTFDEIKNPQYLESLKADITHHGIVNALIITKSSLLIEGHSRLIIAKELNLKSVPVRIILTELSDQALKERVYLGNLNRFEISKDARTKMFADLYPHIFYHAESSIPEALAKQMGLSTSQVRNERQLLLLAKQIKEEHNDCSALTTHDIRLARSKINQLRRERERLKRMQWQPVDQLPQKPFENLTSMPLFLSHEETRPNTDNLDITQEYKLFSQGSRLYSIYTKDDQLVAQLDPYTFNDLSELDSFAKQLILNFHQLRKDRKKQDMSS